MFGTDAPPDQQQQGGPGVGQGLGPASYESVTLETADKEGTFVPGRRNKSNKRTDKQIKKKNSSHQTGVDGYTNLKFLELHPFFKMAQNLHLTLSRHLGCWGQNMSPYAQGCDLS